MKFPLLFSIFGCLLTASNGFSAVTSVRWYNDRRFVDSIAAPLPSGQAGVSDGTLIELGFYSNAVASSPFRGEWMVLAAASIGDTNVNVDGYFDIVSTLTDPSLQLPLEGTPLAVRFYDSYTAEQSQFYNAVSNTSGAWNWINSADPSIMMELAIIKPTASIPSSLGLRFEDNGADWKTAIVVPEPITGLLLLLSGLGLGLQRKR